MILKAFYRQLCRCALLLALCMTVLCLSACIVIQNDLPPAEDELPPILPNDPVESEQDVDEPSDLPDHTVVEQPTAPTLPEEEQVVEQPTAPTLPENEQVAEQKPAEEEPTEEEPTESEPTESEPTESESDGDTTVWITERGTKYHTSATCSGMIEPTSLPLADAQQQGYTACKRCY